MFLDRIDIDAHGPLSRVELGPFSEHLNVVCCPEGSGKTAIARFIRDSLVHREYPLGMMSSSSGRVVWADRNGLVHCRREKDGTATGRRTVQFDPRGDFVDHFDSLQRSWLRGVGSRGVGSSTDASRAAQSIQIPESIVDGVITDTAVTSVARVVSACIRSSLDDPRTLDSLPLSDGDVAHDHHHRRSLRAQLAEVEAELARLQGSTAAYDSLLARRRDLTAQLGREQQRTVHPRRHHVDNPAAHAIDLQHRMDRLRMRQDELRRSIATLDIQIQRHGKHPTSYLPPVAMTDSRMRRQLDDLDAQMIRWRRTLTEVHALRDAISRYVGHGWPGITASAAGGLGHGYFPTAVDDVDARRRRLDGLLHHHEKNERHAQIDPFTKTHRLTPKDIDHRIDAATRQIDWLLERYTGGNDVVVDWYSNVPCSMYGSEATVAETLRSIRHDLTEIRQRTGRTQTPNTVAGHLRQAINLEIDELYQCERWLSAAIDQLVRRRDSLQGSHATRSSFSDGTAGSWSLESLQRKRARRISDLQRVTLDLNDCESRAQRLRHDASDSRWYNESINANGVDREAILSEIKHVDAQLAAGSRAQWLRARRSQLMHELGIVGQRTLTTSPLAEEASRWLVRLSAGRLRNVAWPYASFKSASLAHSIHLDSQRSGVCIDGRDESECTASDRALTALAVRIAAGCILAKTGRAVPLVVETHRELMDANGRSGTAYESTYHDWDIHGRSNHPVVAAIGDYAKSGRQVVLLTSNQAAANQIHRDGGRAFHLFADRIVHAHRPVWQSHYAPERYVGPHPHTYGNELAVDARVRDDETFHRQYPDREYPLCDAPLYNSPAPNIPVPSSPAHSSAMPERLDPRQLNSVEAINRNFDTAWREAYGLYDNPDQSTGLHETDWAPPGAALRDGYYASESYTTTRPTDSIDRRQAAEASQTGSQVAGQRTSSPFYLSVDSPIDQAPSIDAVAAARLRGLKITHINHLMQQDSNRLADALGLANVDAATIRRWQSECRLCCRVPHLRGFDSRVLVGCGVTDPAQLASIPPDNLLRRVESFLTTAQGQRILRSGSSHELSRITTWIASARGTAATRASALGSGRVVNGKVLEATDTPYAFDADGGEYQSGGRAAQQRSRRQRQYQKRTTNGNGSSSADGNGDAYGIVSGNGSGVGSTHGSRYGVSDETGNSNGGDGRTSNGSGQGYANGTSNRSGKAASNGTGSGDGYGYGGNGNGAGSNGSNRTSGGNRSRSRSRNGQNRSRRFSERTPREYVPAEHEPREYSDRDSVDREHSERQRSRRSRRQRNEREPREAREQASESTTETELRFYLQRDSEVVDAPSIGTRMAERLNEVGIETVDDLLAADPESLAAQLDHKRADAETIESWQHQATLVCRIPMLRGHDAQLLVAAEYTTPEEVAESDADEMFSLIDPISRSSEGKRIIRGGKLPDLAEIKDWIGFAQHTRDLMAA